MIVVAMDTNTLLAFLFAIVLLYIVGRVLFVPLKFLGKLLLNAVIGGAVLWVLNIFGGAIGIHVGINVVTALIVGFLGIPGVLLLVILQFLV